MIERLGPDDSRDARDMLAREFQSDMSALLTWFQGAAAYAERTVRGEAEFTDASSRQTAATTSKQCFLGVRSVFGSLRNSLERALSSVKNLEEDAKQHEATQDQLIEENFLANKKWLQLVTAPYENGSDVLKQIASNLGIKPAVPHHAWPSKQTLAPVVEAKLPAEVASYLKDLEGLKKPLTPALEGAVDAFHSKKGKSLVHSDSAFKFYRALKMLPPPPKVKGQTERQPQGQSIGEGKALVKVVQQESTPSSSGGHQQDSPSTAGMDARYFQLPHVDSAPEVPEVGGTGEARTTTGSSPQEEHVSGSKSKEGLEAGISQPLQVCESGCSLSFASLCSR
ncbi:TPA: hypothetical protein ACH3X1_004696 [Trebouxia sp. C0004]